MVYNKPCQTIISTLRYSQCRNLMTTSSDGAAAELAPSKPGQKRSRLTPCCQCNGQNARCKSCSCVRKGQFCTNCSAVKNGHCSNAASVEPLGRTAEPQVGESSSSSVLLSVPMPVSVQNSTTVGSLTLLYVTIPCQEVPYLKYMWRQSRYPPHQVKRLSHQYLHFVGVLERDKILFVISIQHMKK